MKVVKLSKTSMQFGVAMVLAAGASFAQDGRVSARITRPVGIAGSAELELALPLVAPNPLLQGTAKLSFNDEPDPPEQTLTVSIDEGGEFSSTTYSLFIADSSGTLQAVGVLEGTETSGTFEMDGGSDGFAAFIALLGVADLSDLQRRLLEIRVGGSAQLVGAVPLLGSQTLCAAPDPGKIHVKGRLDLARNGTRSTIDLRVEGLNVVNAAYGLFVEDAVGSGVFEFVSSVEPVHRRVISEFDNAIAYRVDTRNGDRLPLDVTSLDDLAGRAYFVLQDEDITVAEGLFPAIPVPGVASTSARIRAPFVRPEVFVPDSTARGFVELQREAKTGRQILVAQVYMRRATNFANGEGKLFFELTPGSRVFNEVACFFEVVQGSRLRLRVPISTSSGEALPLGALSLDALTGRRMQVRDPGGMIYLEGWMPPLPAPGAVLGKVQATSALSNLDPINFPSAECGVTLRLDQRGNTVHLAIQTLGLRGGPVFEIWMTDPRTGLLDRVANLNWPTVTDYVVDTAAGEPLPFGILDPYLLSGLALEIREQGNGAVLSGTMPILP